MRVAAKALQDGQVQPLKAQVVLQPRLVKQAQCLLVHRQRLAVHIGHVGKAALGHRQRRILPTQHQLLRQAQRQRVLRKSARCVAPHVTRTGPAPAPRPSAPQAWPADQTARSAPLLQHSAKTLRNQRIQRRVFGKVLFFSQLVKQKWRMVSGCIRICLEPVTIKREQLLKA